VLPNQAIKAMNIRELASMPGFLGVFLLASPGALAQYEYHYSYGNSRVVQQDETGLAHPSGSYITSGTLSKSAQGAIQTGSQVNPNLPRVNQGSYCGTPGDNMYGAHPIYSPAEEEQARVRSVRAQQRRVLNLRRQQQAQPEQQKGYFYEPGENLKAGSGAFMSYPTPSGANSGPAIYNRDAMDQTQSGEAVPLQPASRRY
jgi:hypothetical protein